MMQVKARRVDSIDGSGYPLAFQVAEAEHVNEVITGAAGDIGIRVEARSLYGHQKEVVVREGEGGAVWRLVSDEGPNLKGTDLAPFPLGFLNAAMHADFLQRALLLARAHEIALGEFSSMIDNHYTFSGSFFKGTGKGTADAVRVRAVARSSAVSAPAARVFESALAASPVHAAFAIPLTNVFALYVNGRRCPVRRVAASGTEDVVDPFLAHGRAPGPLAGRGAVEPIITRLEPDPDDRRPKLIAPEGFVPLIIRGAGEFVDAAGVVAVTVLPPAPGARFRIMADNCSVPRCAPSPLALAAAGVAFCFMTQLGRYIEHRKYQVDGIRLVQTNRFSVTGRAEDFSLRADAGPFETHVFLNARESDEVMQTLIEIAENTCYLHAALRNRLPSRLELVLPT